AGVPGDRRGAGLFGCRREAARLPRLRAAAPRPAGPEGGGGRMKPCTQLRAFASLDGGADVRRDLLSHARTCPSCAAWLVEEAELVCILDEKPPPIEPGSPVLQVRDVIL